MHLALLAALLSGMSYSGLRNLKEQRRYALSDYRIKTGVIIFVIINFYSIIGEYRYLNIKRKQIKKHKTNFK